MLGSAFLLLAGGINGLILPIRGTAEGYSALSLGFLGTGWALGYILGCILVPNLVANVGHVRAFAVMAAMATLSILMSVLIMTPLAWIIFRAVAGFAFAGAAMIVESWLNERSEPSSRGMVFGAYTMVNLAASTVGQLSLNLGNTNSFHFFIIGAVFYCLALIPTAISTSNQPQPLVRARLDIRALWTNSPVSVVAVLLIGLSNSSFGTLGAVYANNVGFDLASVSLFMSIPILAGALAQIPVGFVSDRADRRLVLIGVSLLAIAGDLIFIISQPQTLQSALFAISLFGAAIFALYPIAVAHANDHAPPNDFVRTSGGLLLLFGIGSMAGPVFSGVAMSFLGPVGLFITTIIPHSVLVLFTAWRMTKRAGVDTKKKSAFVLTTPLRTTTQTVILSQDGEQTQDDKSGNLR